MSITCMVISIWCMVVKGHDWSTDCEKCARCGRTRNHPHDWSTDCEKCARCERTRSNQHEWLYTQEEDQDGRKKKKCSKCGSIGWECTYHHWVGDYTISSILTCSKCGEQNDADAPGPDVGGGFDPLDDKGQTFSKVDEEARRNSRAAAKAWGPHGPSF